jgi:histidinol dehydrogenase
VYGAVDIEMAQVLRDYDKADENAKPIMCADLLSQAEHDARASLCFYDE